MKGETMKSQNNDTRNALGLLLILVIVAAGALSSCGNTEPTPAALDAESARTAEKVRVQWLIADKTTVEQGGLTVTGAANFSGGTGISGGSTLDTLTVTGASALDGGITVDTTNFTVNGTTGAIGTMSDIVAGGSATLLGGISAGAGGFTVNSSTASVGTTGSLQVGQSAALNGGITVDTTNFVVNGTTGAVSSASNLTIAGTAKVTGATTITGTLAARGDITVSDDITITDRIVGADIFATDQITTYGDVYLANGAFIIDAGTGKMTVESGAKISPVQAITDTGVLYTCAAPIDHTDVVTTGMCTLPPGADIVDAALSVYTGFNDSGTDKIYCGTTYLLTNQLFDNVSVENPGVGRIATTTGLGNVGASPKTLYCIYKGQNSNSTAGAAILLIYYIVN